MIVTTDKPGSLALRRATRPAHLAYLQTLVDQNRLFLAGARPKADSPTPTEDGFYGSLIVAEFDTLAQAQAFAENDPYAQAGLFSNVLVQPLLKALP
nr:YciI family protein [Sinimarinibacterium sp. NLF-5-8]